MSRPCGRVIRSLGCAWLQPGYDCCNNNDQNSGENSMDRLKGKTALVVGAGSIGPGWGNGKATAVTFAREGAQVFCVDRNGKAAQETVDIIPPEGGKATAFTADVSRAADVEAMVAACLKTYGRIDVLDNNVGIAEMGSVVGVSGGRRLDHQHLVDPLDPPYRRVLCQLCHHQGRDEPDDAHHGGRIRLKAC